MDHEISTISRRRVLQMGVGGAAALAGAARLSAQPASSQPIFADVAAVPVSGLENQNLTSFDELMTGFLVEHQVPGASLAVTRGGRLVYARGFGYADVAKKEPVQPTSVFRIASVSKPLTAVAVLQLIEKQKLKPDDKAFDVLKFEPHLENGASVDARLADITVLQLLQHTAGWDRAVAFDPIGRIWEIAASMKVQPPITPEQIVRYMMGRPLDFKPGERYAYSNLGYLVLGRIIALLSGQPYDEYLKSAVLAPVGISRVQLGKGAIEQRAEGEVRYYDRQEKMARAVVGPRIGEQVPYIYGGQNLEGYEAHGGWIASAVDLVRFASAFDQPDRCPLLGEKAIEFMFARPLGSAGHESEGQPKPFYYGSGWFVRPQGKPGQVNAWHTGHIVGTSTLLVRRWDGLTWAVLFNTDRDLNDKVPAPEIDPLVHRAANAVQKWPDSDLFRRLLK